MTPEVETRRGENRDAESGMTGSLSHACLCVFFILLPPLPPIRWCAAFCPVTCSGRRRALSAVVSPLPFLRLPISLIRRAWLGSEKPQGPGGV